MRSRLSMAALVVALTCLPQAAVAKTYKLDLEHTNVTFQIRHLFTQVDGRFDKFDGKITLDTANLADAKVTGTIDASSINTHLANRDKHLRSADFFDVAKYPTITFESTKITDLNPKTNTGKMHGKLTMHGVTKDIVLDAAFIGEGPDSYGNRKAGFSAVTKINRKDFGLNWNDTLETGGLLVGEEVEIRISVEAYVEDE